MEPSVVTNVENADRLAIQLLGGMAVLRGNEPCSLPRSKKCRALIAYLAATGRPHRRERLCELFWELPDDPKGALRWSLSKIRPLLGSALIADREWVRIETAGLAIDAAELIAAKDRLQAIATAGLERLAERCGAVFCDGLDLSRAQEYQTWLIATREDVRQAQLGLLDELSRRFENDPARALPYARKRVECDPLSEQARLALVETLARSGRRQEADQQRALAVEVLGEAGIAAPSGLLRRPKDGGAPARQKAPRQKVQFCTAPDGTRIAYSKVGEGPPIVKTANWLGHLEFEWESPLLRHWLLELSRGRTLVRYDARGNGLSDRSPEKLSQDTFIEDLETVVDAAALGAFDLIGISQGCVPAIAYAVAHPERVRKLVLFGGFAAGWTHHESAEIHAHWEAIITLTGAGWGKDNPAFRQIFTSLFAPRASSEQADWFNELQRVSASPTQAQRLLRTMGSFDVRPLLDRLQPPTLIFHCRDDALVPFGAGRHLAANIPGAEFVALESDNHLPLEDEPAWPVFVERLREFLSR